MPEQDHPPLIIHFVHAAATPHNNFLLDVVAMIPGVELHRHYLFGTKAAPGRPWSRMSAGDAQIEHIRTGIGPNFDWSLLKLVLFDRKSVFFVIGWDYPILVWILAILGVRRRPTIMWDDGPSPESIAKFDQFWRPRQMLKRIIVYCINRTQGAYFYTGQFARLGIERLGIATHKLHFLPFFVKPGKRDKSLREQYGITEEMVLILAGGRLVSEKGFDVFLHALALIVAPNGKPWKALLVGTGEKADLLHALAEDLNISDQVDFVPWAEPDRFADFIHSSDIFVAPARFDHFPTTVIAALQAGVAVAATNGVGSAVEFIESNESGKIVPVEDPAALAQVISELIANPLERSILGNAGQRVISEWHVSRGAAMIVDSAKAAYKKCVV